MAGQSWTKAVLNLDRRIIFGMVFLCVMLPLLMPIGLPFKINPPAETAYKTVESLPKGSAILISVDFGPSTVPETMPVLQALLHQCFRRGLRPVLVSLVPDGRAMAIKGLREVSNALDAGGGKLYPDIVEGRDYAFLGYKAGSSAVILGLGQSIEATYPTDAYDKPISGMELFGQIKKLSDFKLIFDIAAVGLPEIWISYGSERYGVPLTVACTAVSAVQYYPFYRAGQFHGLVNGMRGAAEYETLVGVEKIIGRKPDATKGMDAQTVTHMLIVLAIILANIAYFIDRKNTQAAGRAA
jgi:hypothetical protein